MMKTKNGKFPKNSKKVKEIEIKKKLEREIEEILYKQITTNDDIKNGTYLTKKNSIFRKDKEN